MIVMGMMPMMDNSVDEIPVPFMSVEQTTESLNSVQNILPMREERRPTLGTYWLGSSAVFNPVKFLIKLSEIYQKFIRNLTEIYQKFIRVLSENYQKFIRLLHRF